MPESSGDICALIEFIAKSLVDAAEVHSDVPDRFAEGMKLFALSRSGDLRREVEIESLWPHKGLLVLKFVGVDSMSDAETLIGSELQVPRSERAELERGWNYVSD